MRRSCSFVYGAIVACTTAVVAPVFGQQQPQPAQSQVPAPPTSQSAADAIRPYLDALRTAPTPSTTIDAYARAYSINPEDPSMNGIFVRRMVDLGWPDLAEYQAQAILARDPGDGLAHAVIAYTAAKRDDMPMALSEIAAAADRLPSDAFVVTTAAQLVAWFDLTRDPQQVAKVATPVRQAVQAMRQRLGPNPTFSNAYARAREATIQNQNSQQTSAPQQAVPGPTIYEPQATSGGYVEYPYPAYVYNPPVVVGGYYAPLPPSYYGHPHRPHDRDQDRDHDRDHDRDNDRPDRPNHPDRPPKPGTGGAVSSPPIVRSDLGDTGGRGNIVIKPVNPNPKPPGQFQPMTPRQPVVGPPTPGPAAPAPSAPTTIDRPARSERGGTATVRPATPSNDRPGTVRPSAPGPQRPDADRRSSVNPTVMVAPNPTIASNRRSSPLTEPAAKPMAGGTSDISRGIRAGGTQSVGARSSALDLSNPSRSPGMNLSAPPRSGSIDLNSPPRSGSIDLNNPPRGGSIDLNNPPPSGSINLSNPPQSGSIDLNNPPRGGTVNIASPPASPFVNVANPPASPFHSIAGPPTPGGTSSISGTGGVAQPMPAPTRITQPPAASSDISGTHSNHR